MKFKKLFKNKNLRYVGMILVVVLAFSVAAYGGLFPQMFINEGGGPGEYSGYTTTTPLPTNTPITTTPNTGVFTLDFKWGNIALFVGGISAALILIVYAMKRKSMGVM